jgi:DNA-binding Lrp family transcriptional regulator
MLVDNIDKNILSELQNNFPISANPYNAIAGRVGLTEDELWKRIQGLIDNGTIRRIGLSLDSKKLGFSSTLAAIRVHPDQITKASAFINTFHEVTHSYQRRNNYNIWFTLIAENETRIEEILEIIRAEFSLNVLDVLNLPVKKLFKLDARFSAKKQK